MKIYLIHTNGIISSAIHSTAEPPLTPHLEIDFQGDLGQLLTEYYIQDNELVYIGAAPTFAHKIVPGVGWVPQIEIAEGHKSAEIDQERTRRNFLPIIYTGKRLDADATAQNNLSNKLQEVRERVRLGIPMPPELLVWKGEDNVVHVWETDQAYLDWLAGFAIAVSERGTRLYGAAWAHKTAIAAMTTVDAILDYDITAGWPD